MSAEIGQATLDEWIKKIKVISGHGFTGGQLVSLREVLQGAFQTGLNFNDWSPIEDQEEGIRTRGSALYQWWMQTAHDEIVPMVEKANEYGGQHRATDLTELGRTLVAAGIKIDNSYIIAGIGPDQLEAKYQELGCYFYLQGKFGRWTAAIKEGRPVSLDTLHDIGIYVRMVQRIRAVGGWPV